MKKLDKFIYNAKLVRVVDGDTCDALIDLGFDTFVKKKNTICWCRYLGIQNQKPRGKEKRIRGKKLYKKNVRKFR